MEMICISVYGYMLMFVTSLAGTFYVSYSIVKNMGTKKGIYNMLVYAAAVIVSAFVAEKLYLMF